MAPQLILALLISGPEMLLLAGIALLVFGAVLMIKYPKTLGGRIKAPFLEIDSPGGGLPVIGLGIVCIIVSNGMGVTIIGSSTPSPEPTVFATTTPFTALPASTFVPTPTVTPTFAELPTSTFTPSLTITPTPTVTPTLPTGEVQFLRDPWQLRGNNGAAELYQSIAPGVLQGKDTLQVTINLHGLNALGGDASALVFDQGGDWHYVSLSDFVQNGLDGLQTVNVPLASFPGLNLSAPVDTLHTRFWSSGSFAIDITSIIAYAAQQSTSTPMLTTPTNTAAPPLTRTPRATMTSTPRQSSTPASRVRPVATQSIGLAPTPIKGVELLPQPWHLLGNDGAAELYQSIAPNVLQGKSKLRITYNLHGLSALDKDASAIIFDQNGWQYISLANYGTNGLNGQQVVTIPLASFMALNPNQPVTMIHTRFWHSGPFAVDITSIVVY